MNSKSRFCLKQDHSVSRRHFVKSTAAVSAGLAASKEIGVYGRGSDIIRVGLVGCGGRGTGAVINCFDSSKGVELVAMADMFQDKVDTFLETLKKSPHADKVKVKDTIFLGFDAYKKLLETDVHIVILATPPHFRPEHLKACVNAGKHVFAEKPFAVDPVGARSIIETAGLADQKGISIVVGTQQRRQYHYLDIINRIHNGELGEIVGGQCYWNWGKQDWHLYPRQPEWSDMEWQIRNWPFFTWLSGDHIVEQHFHNLDIINWAMGSPPATAIGLGGRQARIGKKYGNIWDHFTVEFEYPNGARVMSMASQINGTTPRVGERVVCSKGSTWTDRSRGYIEGQNPFTYDGEMISGLEKEHADLIEAIRKGDHINEAKRAAETNMTAILGRMSAYTGRAIKWSWAMNASKLDLTPTKYEMGDLPVGPIAVPGKTKLI